MMSPEGTSPDAAALEALDEATRAIGGLLDVEAVLQLIVDRVRPLVGAQYAALGVVGADGWIERFITAGISPEQRAAIGPLPQGHGLLGSIIRHGTALRVADISGHPDSVGFPPNHPPMTSLLGVPIRVREVVIGNLYLTDKGGAAEFTAADQRLVEMFATHAGIAIDNARLHAQVGQFAVVEERDRIGREIHDGIIQSLYAISLSLEDVPDLLDESRDQAEARIDRAIDDLHLAIRELRSFIHGLRPEALDGSDVPAGIVVLTEQFRHNALLEVDLDVESSAAAGLPADRGLHVLQLTREALSNIARHSGASHVVVRLTGDEAWRLEIADDGVGFDVAGARDDGHHGIGNMRARAQAIGADLRIESATAGPGTRILLTMPAHTRPDET